MGTRAQDFYKADLMKDHPHAYGDKFFHAIIVYWVIGSSPRVWGQGGISCVYPVAVGIIPTRMGTSSDKKISYMTS